jgi:hypothetical protein
LWRVTFVRLTPVPTAERGSERDDGGGVRFPRVNSVGQLLGRKRFDCSDPIRTAIRGSGSR